MKKTMPTTTMNSLDRELVQILLDNQEPTPTLSMKALLKEMDRRFQFEAFAQLERFPHRIAEVWLEGDPIPQPLTDKELQNLQARVLACLMLYQRYPEWKYPLVEQNLKIRYYVYWCTASCGDVAARIMKLLVQVFPEQFFEPGGWIPELENSWERVLQFPTFMIVVYDLFLRDKRKLRNTDPHTQLFLRGEFVDKITKFATQRK